MTFGKYLPRDMTEAIRAANLASVVEILRVEPDIAIAKTSYTVNWLHYASGHSSLDVVRYFFEAVGLDPNENHAVFGNALYNAAFKGKNDIVRYLLGKGVELNVSQPQRNPLFGAITGDGTIETVQALLEGGIDASIKYSLLGGHRPMGAEDRAFEQGKPDVALLIKGWNLKRAVVN